MITVHSRKLIIGTTAERTAYSPPAESLGMMFYDTTDNKEYYWNGASWTAFGTGSGGTATASENNYIWHVDGSLATGTQLDATYLAPVAGTINRVILYIEDLGSAGSTIIDIHKNGTTIFTNQAHRPEIAYDAAANYVVVTPDVTDLSENDILTFEIDQVATDAGNLTCQAAVAAGLIGSDGWMPITRTWARDSADAPVYVISGDTDIDDAISVGMKVKFTQDAATVYGIVHAVSGTDMTIYCGTDYTVSANAISDLYYSMARAPRGFPMDPSKWTVSLLDTGTPSQASPTNGVWYNLGSLSISIPIGIWNVNYSASVSISHSSSVDCYIKATLSTANNSESDVNNTVFYRLQTANLFRAMLQHHMSIIANAKTTYYLNESSGAGSVTTLQLIGSVTKTQINAVDTYL